MKSHHSKVGAVYLLLLDSVVGRCRSPPRLTTLNITESLLKVSNNLGQTCVQLVGRMVTQVICS